MQAKSTPQKIAAWFRDELRIWKSLLVKPHRDDVTEYPILHYFPDLGADGQVTIDCIVRPSSGSALYDATLREQFDDGKARVTPLRVGSLDVEIDQLGLRLRWKPAQEPKDSFLSPFGRTPAGKEHAKPADQRQGNPGV